MTAPHTDDKWWDEVETSASQRQRTSDWVDAFVPPSERAEIKAMIGV